jgi:predicted GTPase
MGYGDAQVKELEQTIARVPCDAVVVGTPIDLTRVMHIRQPVVRARYELQEIGRPDLEDALKGFLEGVGRLVPPRQPVMKMAEMMAGLETDREDR